MKLADVKVGQRFQLSGVEHLRIADIPFITDKYPEAIIAVNMEDYKVMVVHPQYEVVNVDSATIEDALYCMMDDCEYQGEVHNDKCN